MKATPVLSVLPGGAATTDTYVSTVSAPGPDDYAVSRLVAALEDAWNAIRANHPQIPPVVVIVGPGTGPGIKQPVHGHYSALRWHPTSGDASYSEVMVAGEGLNRPAREVMGTLLHEAAHALADVNNIRETSRQGRWHNKHFARLAGELGLVAVKDTESGYATQMPDLTANRYAATIAALEQAITLYRRPEQAAPRKKRDNSNNPIGLECACPRKIKVAPTIAEAGPIRCDVCGHRFMADGQPDPDTTPDPTGEHHEGMPTYPYGTAPDELVTRRQLGASGLRPNGQPIAARVIWRHGTRFANLYRRDLAAPKRVPTDTQLVALARANQARHLKAGGR